MININQHLYRADIYRLLAMCFDKPSDANLEAIKGLVNELCETGLSSEEGRIEAILVNLNLSLQTSAPADLLDLYTRLFLTVTAAPPSEGSYHMAERGPILADISGFYEAFGFRARESAGPPDQMKMQLAFMHYMAMKTVNAATKDNQEHLDVTLEAQRKFLDDHIGRWEKRIAQKMVEYTEYPFYLAVADLLVAWIEEDCKHFSVDPSPVPQNLLSVLDNSHPDDTKCGLA